MIRLYDFKLSPFCHRVKIVLVEKELDYQTVSIDLMKKENRTEQYLRLNPLGKVPVLADDDLIISDSAVISEYLNDEYPFPELSPEDPQEKAQMRVWVNWVNGLIADPWLELLRAGWAKEKGESVDEAKLETAREKIKSFFEVADRSLKGKDFLVGKYSLADIAFAPWVFLFEEVGITVPNLPNLSVWFKRLSTKNTVVKTKP